MDLLLIRSPPVIIYTSFHLPHYIYRTATLYTWRSLSCYAPEHDTKLSGEIFLEYRRLGSAAVNHYE